MKNAIEKLTIEQMTKNVGNLDFILEDQNPYLEFLKDNFELLQFVKTHGDNEVIEPMLLKLKMLKTV